MTLIIKRLSLLAIFIGSLWVIHILNVLTGDALTRTFGLVPRSFAGLDGILGMPFLHGSFEHLISNSIPLSVMGGLLAATATRALVTVNIVIVLLGGALVWIFAGSAIHIGASGLVFGWFGFLVARGVVDRSPITIAAALFVGGAYGAIVWGVLPGQPGVSWEAHLFGAVAGGVAAIFVKSHVHAPRLTDVDRL